MPHIVSLKGTLWDFSSLVNVILVSIFNQFYFLHRQWWNWPTTMAWVASVNVAERRPWWMRHFHYFVKEAKSSWWDCQSSLCMSKMLYKISVGATIIYRYEDNKIKIYHTSFAMTIWVSGSNANTFLHIFHHHHCLFKCDRSVFSCNIKIGSPLTHIGVCIVHHLLLLVYVHFSVLIKCISSFQSWSPWLWDQFMADAFSIHGRNVSVWCSKESLT